MYRKIDLTKTGGFPFTQDTLDYLQTGWSGALDALGAVIGNKVILSGVVVSGASVSAGWIVYNNEIIPFIGGSLAAQVVISNTGTPKTFQDDSVNIVQFEKTATCGSSGDFPFSDLVRLQSLVNIWNPGDIKQKVCDNVYIAANFDADGYGLNREAGWRLISKAYPSSAGKTFVNLDTSDTDFDTIGKIGGEKKHQLTTDEIAKHYHYEFSATGSTTHVGNDLNELPESTPARYLDDGGGEDFKYIITGVTNSPAAAGRSSLTGGDNAHNNMQPYFVVLTLIKL